MQTHARFTQTEAFEAEQTLTTHATTQPRARHTQTEAFEAEAVATRAVDPVLTFFRAHLAHTPFRITFYA